MQCLEMQGFHQSELDTLESKIDRLLTSRLDALLSKKLATAGAIASLPAPSTKPKAPANAPVGHGMLAELRANVVLVPRNALKLKTTNRMSMKMMTVSWTVSSTQLRSRLTRNKSV